MLKVNINKKASTLVVINIITTVEFDDDRSFIGYQIYHTSDPYGNVTRDNYQPCLDRCVKANCKMNWNPLMPLTSLHFTLQLDCERAEQGHLELYRKSATLHQICILCPHHDHFVGEAQLSERHHTLPDDAHEADGCAQD